MSHIFIGIIAPATILIPIAASIRWFARQPSCTRYVFYYLVVSACINLAAILLSYQGSNNLPLLHLLTVLELLFLSCFFACQFKNKIAWRIKWLGWLSILFCIINSIWLQSIYTFNSYARGLETILIIILSVYFFMQVTEQVKPVGEIYIVCGLLLYYAGSFFLFLFSNYLQKGHARSTLIWNINSSLAIALYLLITIGIVKCRKHPITSMSSS